MKTKRKPQRVIITVVCNLTLLYLALSRSLTVLLFRIKLTLFLVYIFLLILKFCFLSNYCHGSGLVTDISGRSRKSDCSETVPILISPLECVSGGGGVCTGMEM